HFLSQLRGASLVVTEESGLDDQLAEIRFRLLEPLREFAGEQLTADEKYSLQESHARYFLHLAQQAENAFNSPQQMSWLARVAASADNFRAALAWALEQRPELALALAGSLAPFWQVHNHLEEGRSWLKQALERHGQIPEKNSLQDAAMQILRIKALLGAGRLAFYVGDFPAAHIHLNETIELSRSQQDWYNLALALQTLGHMELNEGKTEAALTSVQEALELSRQIEDQALIAENLRLLGGIYIGQGDYNPALPILEECQAIIRILGQNLNLAHTLDLLAFVHIGLGDKAGARLAWEDSLAIARAVHDGYLIGKTLWGLGTLARAAGELSYASELLGEATRVALETDNKWMRPFMLEAVAYLAAEKNKPTDAAQILGASEALRAALGSPLLPIFLPDYEHYVARLHSALDAATFDTAWTTGQQMSFEQAAAVALSCCTH
ncbi:MAG: tetratricopeptide repeat protein, partial [Abitibacteriaceae bacterium]|nr:tetratricopeptide repeat protein [Abditibacteriaceae bacterium]